MSSLRMLEGPSKGSVVKERFDPARGGIGSIAKPAAAIALNAVPLNRLNVNSGVAGLDQEGHLISPVIPFDAMGSISVAGPTLVSVGSVTQYLITNFDSFTEYFVEAIDGGVEINEDLITYYAPNESILTGFIINGREYRIQVQGAVPNTPTISVSQEEGALNKVDVTLMGSAFSIAGNVSIHNSTDWQIATDVAFTNIVRSSMNDTANKLIKEFIDLEPVTPYHARARYRDSNGLVSDWATSSFTTPQTIAAAPQIQTHPSPSQYGADGSNVSFSITLTTASEGPFTYTWERNEGSGNWVQHQVQNSSSRTNTIVVTVSVANNGWQYRCRASNEGGNVQSNPGTLNLVTFGAPAIWQKGSSIFSAGVTSMVQYAGFDVLQIYGATSISQVVDALWPAGTGALAFMYIAPAQDYSGVFPTNVTFTMDGVSNSGAWSEYAIRGGDNTGFDILAMSAADWTRFTSLANNGKTVTISFTAGGQLYQTNVSLSVLECPRPSGLEWTSSTNLNQTYGVLSLSGGVNYYLRSNIHTLNQARVQDIQLISGTLPPGMTLASASTYNTFRGGAAPNGFAYKQITQGNPTQVGTYNFTIRLTWANTDTTTSFNDYPVTIQVVA